MTPETAQALGAGAGMFVGSGLATWGVRMLARAWRAARAPAPRAQAEVTITGATGERTHARDLSQTPAEALASAYYARISAGRPPPLPIVPSVIPPRHSFPTAAPTPVAIEWEIRPQEKSPGRPAPLATVAGEIVSKHSQLIEPVPDFGAQARARAREVRDAVAGLGYPLVRAQNATESALERLGGGCPELEVWVPEALRVLAPPARGTPNLGPVQRRPRLR